MSGGEAAGGALGAPAVAGAGTGRDADAGTEAGTGRDAGGGTEAGTGRDADAGAEAGTGTATGAGSRGRRDCLNCGAVVRARYCANCGQPADVHVPTTGELILEALEGLTHSDSRLWRTLKMLWLVPGGLTREFIAGRRARYIPPFRLYLILSVLFFLAASFSPPRDVVVMDAGSRDVKEIGCADVHAVWRGHDWGPRIQRACTQATSDRGVKLYQVALSQMPKAMFIFLPLIAFAHMLMYWRPRHRYVEHLLFLLHLHAFFFSVFTVMAVGADLARAWPWLERWLGWVPAVLFWSLPIYAVLALRRVFDRGWGRTLVKAAALFMVYLVVGSLTVAGVFVYAALQL